MLCPGHHLYRPSHSKRSHSGEFSHHSPRTPDEVGLNYPLHTSVVLAAKTYDDHFYTNSHYARVGGVPVEELNSLEIEFLFNIDFSLYVSVEDYQGYFQEIYKHAMSNTCSCCCTFVLFVSP